MSPKIKSFFLGLCGAAFLVGACAGVPISGTNSPKLRLAFTSNPSLEMEPCGCSLLQAGGVDRAFNVVSKFRRDNPEGTFHFWVGTTFVSLEALSPVSRDFQERRRSEFAEVAREMGVKTIVPSGEDGSLGSEELLRLQRQARVTFLSANLAGMDGKPLFPPYEWLEIGGSKILVFGLSGGPSSTWPLDKSVQLLPFSTALEPVRRAMLSKPDQVILLSNISEEDRALVAKLVPETSIFLGGDFSEEPMSMARRLDPFRLSFVTIGRGRSLGWLQIEANSKKAFFNSDLSKIEIIQRDALLAEKRSLSHGARLTKPQRNRLRQVEAQLSHLAKFQLEPTENANRYLSGMELLTPEYGVPENPISERIRNFKKKIRDLAVSLE